MINEFYKDMTGKGSVIRQFFDYANKKGAEIGMENIYNFSIGNPSVPVPQAFTNRMIELLQTEDPVKLHVTAHRLDFHLQDRRLPIL